MKCPDELKKFEPFYHDIDLGNGYNTSPNTNRIRNAKKFFWNSILNVFGGTLKGKRVLDIGCNCGGFSFLAAQYGASVVGIDIRPENIAQAKAVKTYLQDTQTEFYVDSIENITEQKYGNFDITLLIGILYHLNSPITVFRQISELTNKAIFIDTHLHYDINTQLEDIPSWWMLADSDKYDVDGIKDLDGDIAAYYDFERSTPVDYNQLRSNIVLSPHTERDIKFLKLINHNESFQYIPDNLCSQDLGELVLVPNKKAVIKLLRTNGFGDVMEIVPRRFSEERYIRKYRACLLGVREND